MKKRIGRRELIENLRMMRRQREDAIFWKKHAEDTADRLRAENREYLDRLEKLENDPELQYVGSIPGGTMVQAVEISFATAESLRDDKNSREYIRRQTATMLANEIIERGLIRIQYGGEPDPLNIRAEPFDRVHVVARLDVVPWDRMVRRTVNGLMIEPRRFYEERMVPPIYEDMARNEELARCVRAPWE